MVSTRDLPLYAMMGHQLGWSSDPRLDGGFSTRRLGSLCLGACAALGGNLKDALPASTAVELVQNFCDIHDDIQSGRIERHGRDTVWWKWGPAQAINAGDGMHALARMTLLEMTERGFGPDIVFEAIRILDRASLETCEGRFMELEFQERLDTTSDAYVKMASLKTGSVFSCAVELGALVSGASPDQRGSLGEWSKGLGVAAQINDDYRQISDALDEVGAPSDDLMNKRKLYPVVWAFEQATPQQRRQLGDYYFKRVLEPSDVRSLALLVDSIGGTAQARSQVVAHMSSAEDKLVSVVQDSSLREGLEQVSRDAVGFF